MRKLFSFILITFMIVVSSCSQKGADNSFILVQGGPFKNTTSNFYGKNITIPDFYISRYEITQKEWSAVMGNDPAQFAGDSLPIESISWYDCILYCNKRSILEGLTPYYTIDSTTKDPVNTNDLDDIKWNVTIHANANGYRLPTEAEWEYAAGGGQQSKSFIYSGSNKVAEVAWYWQNSGDKYLSGNWSWPVLQQNNNRTKPIGSKAPNELGIYDMSGNVREWCWDWSRGDSTGNPQGRVWKGGGWIGADFCCASSFRADHQANGKGPDQGFRVCRNGK